MEFHIGESPVPGKLRLVVVNRPVSRVLGWFKGKKRDELDQGENVVLDLTPGEMQRLGDACLLAVEFDELIGDF